MAIIRKDARQLLTESVKELASKKTINKIAVTEIARNCSMSTSNFYYYFSDKYELVSYIINNEIDGRISHCKMSLTELLTQFLDLMEGNQQFYTNILENTLVEYPNHAFFHETLDLKIKEIIISNCMNSIPNDQLDLTLEVYLAGITATMCTHVISGRSSRRELMNAFITAIPDKLRPHINAEPSQQYLS